MVRLDSVLDHLNAGSQEITKSFQDRNGSIIIDGTYDGAEFKIFMVETGSEIIAKKNETTDFYDLGKDLRKFGKVYLNGKVIFV